MIKIVDGVFNCTQEELIEKINTANNEAKMAKYLGLLLSILNKHHQSIELSDSEVRAKNVAHNLIKGYKND